MLHRAALVTAALLMVVSQATAETSLYMDSDPDDWVGRGQEWYYTESDAVFATAHLDSNTVVIELSCAAGSWDLKFAAPDGELLEVGEYLGATRYPFNEPDDPGLSVSGMGRGCNTVTGEFTVHYVQYGLGTDLVSFRATFEQHCGEAEAALVGDVRINPGTPVLATTWGSIKGLFRDHLE